MHARIRSIALALVMVAMGVVATQAPAAAAPAPTARLTGAFTVEVKVTESQGMWGGLAVGQKARRTYRFVPQCKAGGCRTVLTRTSAGGRVRTEVLEPSRTDPNLYSGKGQITVDCGNDVDGVVVSQGITSVANMRIRVTKRDAGGRATAFLVSTEVVNTPVKPNCTPGREVASGASVRATAAECTALGLPRISGPYRFATKPGVAISRSLPATSPSGSPLRWVISSRTFDAKAYKLVWNARGQFAITPPVKGTVRFLWTAVDVSGCAAKPRSVEIVTS